jgi:hypothetical protein
MILYSVRFKNNFFWHKIKKVKGDGFTENGTSRFIILEDETRIEIPCHNIIFKFSKERFYLIKERMSHEAGQDMNINSK